MIRRILLIVIARLASCFALPIEHVHDATPIATEAAIDAVGARDDAVLVSGFVNAGDARTLIRKSATGSVSILSLPGEFTMCGGEGLIPASDGKWWYSRCRTNRSGIIVEFVTADAPSSVRTRLAPHPVTGGQGWIPLEVDEPAGVLLSSLHPDEVQMRVELVTPKGIEAIGELVRGGHLMIAPGTWRALRLPDERIALVSIEDDVRPDTQMIMLRVFAEGRAVVETMLPFERDTAYSSVSAAVNDRGELAIVTAQRRKLVAMVLDPDTADLPKPRVLAESNAIDPGVIAAGSRFVASWIGGADRRVMLCELDRAFVHPPVIAGENADPDWPMCTFQRADDGFDLFWKSERGLMRRRLPELPTGYLVATEAWVAMRQALRK